MRRRTQKTIASLREAAAHLFYEEEWAYTQIARKLHLSRRTVCRYVHEMVINLGTPAPVRTPISGILLDKKGRADSESIHNHFPLQVGELLASLTKRQRTVFRLYFEQGLNAREIAT